MSGRTGPTLRSNRGLLYDCLLSRNTPESGVYVLFWHQLSPTSLSSALLSGVSRLFEGVTVGIERILVARFIPAEPPPWREKTCRPFLDSCDPACNLRGGMLGIVGLCLPIEP
jgi:hypothetical protein